MCGSAAFGPLNDDYTERMSTKKVWFITGASRGLGLEFSKAALAAGDNVVASSRNPVTSLGGPPNLLTVALDVTDAEAARSAVDAAVGQFGRIDVLVNNAASFYAG